ncbi:MAG: hypothetical protein Q9173_006078 [Seirophora scorigena]
MPKIIGAPDELWGISTAGTRHSPLGMQKHVIRKPEELSIACKLSSVAFLRLADKLSDLILQELRQKRAIDRSDAAAYPRLPAQRSSQRRLLHEGPETKYRREEEL